ncbi:MAG: ribosome assembly RNA-binding protein YhbY [Clostridia bacterium]|nr:ribosome assembly RNA-binding protein YhbY [Clostridia bacterium]MBO7150918.1 ribosome assembly RNA-binding protein YhbY [Clostridia bacterium]
MLTPKNRNKLRAMATELDPIFQIGKAGISEETIRQLDAALEARELIKARVLENSGYSAREAAEEIAEATGADVVTVIGTKFVLYRRSEKKQRIFFDA